MYYIVSDKWTGKGSYVNQVTFWRPDSRGYTIYLEAAGKYSKEDLGNTPIGFSKGDSYAIPCQIIDDMKVCEPGGSIVQNDDKNIKTLKKWKL